MAVAPLRPPSQIKAFRYWGMQKERWQDQAFPGPGLFLESWGRKGEREVILGTIGSSGMGCVLDGVASPSHGHCACQLLGPMGAVWRLNAQEWDWLGGKGGDRDMGQGKGGRIRALGSWTRVVLESARVELRGWGCGVQGLENRGAGL